MRPRFVLWATWLVMLGTATCFSGCGGSSEPLYRVTGTVTYQGKPATGASVHFRIENAGPEEALAFPIGQVDSEGKFELEVPGVGRGAPVGRYRVLVLWPPDPATKLASSKGSAKQNKDPKNDSDRLRYRYFHLDNPLLTAEVKAESNQLEPFVMKDK